MPSHCRSHPVVAVALLLAVGLAGCAADRPVIYPSRAGAESDIEDCMRLARRGGARDDRSAEVACDTALGAAAGAAAAGIYGAVRDYDDAGEQALAGAAAGASVGLIRGLSKSGGRSAAFKKYVGRCLRDRGYDVVGWD